MPTYAFNLFKSKSSQIRLYSSEQYHDIAQRVVKVAEGWVFLV